MRDATSLTSLPPSRGMSCPSDGVLGDNLFSRVSGRRLSPRSLRGAPGHTQHRATCGVKPPGQMGLEP